MMRDRSAAFSRLAVVAEATFNPVVALLLIPILIATNGAEGLGNFVIVQSIVATCGVFGMGLGLAAVNFVARDGNDPLRGSEATARAAVAGSLVAMAALASLAWGGLPEVAAQAGIAPAEIVRIGFVWGALQLPIPAVLAFLKGRERFVAAATIDVAARIVVYGLFVVVLVREPAHSLVNALWVAVASEAAMLVVRIVLIWRISGVKSLRLPTVRKAYRELGMFAAGVWLQGGTALVFNTVDKFIIAAIAGPATLGAYAATTQIASLVHFVPSTIVAVHVPRIVASRASGKDPSVPEHRMAREVALLTTALAVVAVVFLVLGSTTGAWPVLDLSQHWLPFAAIVLSYIVLAVAIADYGRLMGASRTDVIGLVSVVSACLACLPIACGALLGSVTMVAFGRLAFATASAVGLRRAVHAVLVSR